MSDDRLDLRALGDVESPEVVGAALSEFRRRILTRSLWIFAAIVAAGLVVYQLTRPDTLRDEIERADRTIVAATAEAGDIRLGLDLVSDLGDTFGLHLVVISAPEADLEMPTRWPAVRIRAKPQLRSESWGPFDRYLEVPAGPGGRPVKVSVTVVGPGCAGPKGCDVIFDLDQLGVPSTATGGS
jgi:hypothetical protein